MNSSYCFFVFIPICSTSSEEMPLEIKSTQARGNKCWALFHQLSNWPGFCLMEALGKGHAESCWIENLRRSKLQTWHQFRQRCRNLICNSVMKGNRRNHSVGACYCTGTRAIFSSESSESQFGDCRLSCRPTVQHRPAGRQLPKQPLCKPWPCLKFDAMNQMNQFMRPV